MFQEFQHPLNCPHKKTLFLISFCFRFKNKIAVGEWHLFNFKKKISKPSFVCNVFNKETYFRIMDKFLSKFFGWMDSLMEKVNDVLTFDVGQELKKKPKKKKCKNCHCKCHCKIDLHIHEDQEICNCDNCKCR